MTGEDSCVASVLPEEGWQEVRRDQIMGKSACELVYLLRSTAEGREMIRKKMEEMAAGKQAAII